MKVLSRFYFSVIVLFCMQFFNSCTGGNASFSSEEMRFAKPFSDKSIVIYRSEIGQLDTVTFLNYKIDTIRYRNLEQGFYNENTLSVRYDLSESSYHKITVKGVNGDWQDLMLFLKAKNSHSSRQFSFLGLLFDESYLDVVMSTKDSVVVFNENHARYKGVNVNEGIKSFTFSFKKGIIFFTDNHNIRWERIN